MERYVAYFTREETSRVSEDGWYIVDETPCDTVISGDCITGEPFASRADAVREACAS